MKISIKSFVYGLLNTDSNKKTLFQEHEEMSLLHLVMWYSQREDIKSLKIQIVSGISDKTRNNKNLLSTKNYNFQ